MHAPINILRIVCSDEQGIIAKVSGILSKHHCNIIENDEFVDSDSSHFFMRTAFTGEANLAALRSEVEHVLPADSQVECVLQRKKKVVVLSTKEAHCLGDLLVRSMFDDIYAEVVAVISNHNVLEEMTRKLGFPYHCISHKGIERAAHEAQVMAAIDQYDPDYVVMAKYMRILSEEFIERYKHRIVNIHHSFLPAFIGANPYRQAYERGVKLIGATAHFATVDLDEGPIIAQGTVSANHTHSVKDMVRNGRDVEKEVLARALHLVFEDRVFVRGNRTIVFD